MQVQELPVTSYRLSPLPSGYQPIAGRAAAARWGILVLGVVCSAWLAALVAQYQSIGTQIEVAGAEARVAEVLDVMQWVGLLTAITTVLWLRRAYLNLGPLGVRRRRFGSGWAIGGWFVPVLNAVRPKQLIDEIWQSTDPATPHPIPDGWQGAPVPQWINTWWRLWVGAATLWLAALVIAIGEPTRLSVGLLMLVAAAVVVSAPLFWLLVGQITVRQDARATRVGADEWVRPIRFAAGGPVFAVAGLAAVAVLAFGLATWPLLASETKVTPAGATFTENGVSFAYPFGFAVTAAGSESSGEVVAQRLSRDDSVTVSWSPRAGSGGEAALFEILDTATLEVVAEWGPSIYHGRPVAAIVDEQPGITENFSVRSPANMAYASVTVVECASSDRFLTIVVVADSTRTIRKSLTNLFVGTAAC